MKLVIIDSQGKAHTVSNNIAEKDLQEIAEKVGDRVVGADAGGPQTADGVIVDLFRIVRDEVERIEEARTVAQEWIDDQDLYPPTRSRAEGSRSVASASSGGSSLRMALMVSTAESRWKARWPVTIS